jgi:hypothetical protein
MATQTRAPNADEMSRSMCFRNPHGSRRGRRPVGARSCSRRRTREEIYLPPRTGLNASRGEQPLTSLPDPAHDICLLSLLAGRQKCMIRRRHLRVNESSCGKNQRRPRNECLVMSVVLQKVRNRLGGAGDAQLGPKSSCSCAQGARFENIESRSPFGRRDVAFALGGAQMSACGTSRLWC